VALFSPLPGGSAFSKSPKPSAPAKNAPPRLPKAPTKTSAKAQAAKSANPFKSLPQNALAGAPKLAKAYANAEKPTRAPSPLFQRWTRETEGAAARPIVAPKQKGSGGGGGLSLATITGLPGSVVSDIPKEFTGTGTIEKGIKGAAADFAATSTKGWEKMLGTGGIAKGVAHLIGHGAGDLVELPAQVLPTAYVAGKIGVQGLGRMATGHSEPSAAEHKEIKQLIDSYRHESAIGNLLAGDVKGAGEAAYRHPGYAALEVSGGLAAADRAAGAAARAGAMGPDLAAATKLADPGATTVSRAPQTLLGNAKAPLDPYSKQLSIRLRQGRNDPTVRPGESILAALHGKSLSTQLVKHFDRQTGSLEAVRRNNRGIAAKTRMDAIKGNRIAVPGGKTASYVVKGTPAPPTGMRVPIAGHNAVNAFARGFLADPKILNEHGTPLYRDQLSKLVELHSKPVAGELPFQEHNRTGKVAEYQAMLDDPRLQQHPELAHAAAVKYAQDMHKLEPELVAHDYLTPQSIRVAKLADPFQFHWQGHDPHFSEQPPLNARGQAFVAAEKARADAYTARQGSKVEVNRAQAEHTAHLQLAHAQRGVTHATAVEKIRNLIDLANRPGTAAEGANAVAKIEQLKARHGLTDLSKPADLPTATANLEGVKAKVGTRGGSLTSAKAAFDEAMARHKTNIAAHHAAVADAHGLAPASPMDLHESPFSIATPRKPGQPPLDTRQHIPVDQVERELLQKHGVDPKNIGFVSNRPFVNQDSAYYRSNTDPAKAGFNPQKQRTGAAFLRGQYDTTHDALVRQHLTNQALVDQARGSKMQVKTYALTKAHMADLLQEKVDKLPAGEQPAVKGMIAKLRTGSTYFEPHSGTSAWDHAHEAIAQVQHMHPDLKLAPGRIAHPFAPAKQLDMIAKHTVEAVHDRLDPNIFDRPSERFPQTETMQQLDAGPVAAYPKAIADRMRAYDKQTGKGNMALLRQPASWWRRANVGFSTKHVLGLGQELGIRAATNNIGPLSYMRGLRLMNLVERAAADPNFLKNHPEAELDAQRLQAQVGGTVAQQTQNLVQHVNENQLTSRPAAVAAGLRVTAGRKITGAPLRAIHGVLKAYSASATKILQGERKVLEHPAQIAGLGKHANNEAKRMMGQSLPVVGAVTKVEKQMAEGLLNPEAIDHAARQLVQYWGDWTSASPAVKNVLAVAPFFNWFQNSLKFLYHTMPAHHPIKTALLTTLESATAQQRRAIGQGAGATEKLESEQQGGIPIGGGFTANQQYYTPQGAVSGSGGIGGPLKTAYSLVLPEIQDVQKALSGSGPFGETLKDAKGQPITDENQRALLALSALIESFNPPLRQARTVAKGGRSSTSGSALWDLSTKPGAPTEDPIGRALGIPPGVWAAFKPVKTSKERTETGHPRGGNTLPGLPVINLPEVKLPTVNLPTIKLPTAR
jgi:hypothetical protein